MREMTAGSYKGLSGKELDEADAFIRLLNDSGVSYGLWPDATPEQTQHYNDQLQVLATTFGNFTAAQKHYVQTDIHASLRGPWTICGMIGLLQALGLMVPASP